MNSSTDHGFDGRSTTDGEATLRLIAALPAPAGIEERVKSGLRAAPRQASLIHWPHRSPDAERWTNVPAMRAAAAAAIVMIVAGGGWGVYSHIRLAPQPAAAVTPERISGTSGMAPAGATRKPRTLEGPVIAVPAEVKQRPAANDAAAPPPTHMVKKSRPADAAQNKR